MTKPLALAALITLSIAAPGVAVCGCDGRTYDGVCAAVDAGVDVAHAGSCVAGASAR